MLFRYKSAMRCEVSAQRPVRAAVFGCGPALQRFSQGEVETQPMSPRMSACRHRGHPVVGEAPGSAPDHHIAMIQRQTQHLVRALRATEEEGRAQPEGDRDDGGREVALIAILVQGHARARKVSIDETDIGSKGPKTRGRGGARGDLGHASRQRRPGPQRLWIAPIVPIALPIAHPTDLAAVGHRDRHALSARSQHVPEGSRSGHRFDLEQERLFPRQGETRQVGETETVCRLRDQGSGL